VLSGIDISYTVWYYQLDTVNYWSDVISEQWYYCKIYSCIQFVILAIKILTCTLEFTIFAVVKKLDSIKNRTKLLEFKIIGIYQFNGATYPRVLPVPIRYPPLTSCG